MALNNKGYGPIGLVAHPPVDLLVCFAVKEEAKFFPPLRGRPESNHDLESFQAWITGMGRKNAADGIREAIATMKPERVITAGFAGGLNPKLKFGAVVYEQDFDAGFGPELEELGATPAKFYCQQTRGHDNGGKGTALERNRGRCSGDGIIGHSHDLTGI